MADYHLGVFLEEENSWYDVEPCSLKADHGPHLWAKVVDASGSTRVKEMYCRGALVFKSVEEVDEWLNTTQSGTS